MERKLLAVMLLFAAVCLSPGRLPAEWVEGGNVLDNEIYDAQNALVLPDGEGGAVVTTIPMLRSDMINSVLYSAAGAAARGSLSHQRCLTPARST